MHLTHLSQPDWDEFNDRFPGVWLWLQVRSLRNERQFLERHEGRCPLQEKRLAELLAWAELLQKQGAES